MNNLINQISSESLFKEQPGDDTGMQTRVWGPAGWLFIHSVAQNYPWKPTKEQMTNYYQFFKLIGNVLPCRYCRESYQKFISEPDTRLTMEVLRSRLSLVLWLYLLHNKVNNKLDVKDIPTIQEVWKRYESYRSKCVKSPEVLNNLPKGCLDPMKGFRKRCFINIENVNADGNKYSSSSSSFGKRRKHSFGGRSSNTKSTKRAKLLSIKKSNKSGKKLMATFEVNGRKRVIHFGAAGMSDYTKHKDKQRRQRYIKRHLKDLRTGNPMRAGYLSMYVLWNKPSLSGSIADYKRRFNVYSRTGKFPKKIN